MRHIQTFEDFSFINEGALSIFPAQDKSIRTPFGKPGKPRTIVVLGVTSSGLHVSVAGDFIDNKKGVFSDNVATDQDKKEAIEMAEFHIKRLSGGARKEQIEAWSEQMKKAIK